MASHHTPQNVYILLLTMLDSACTAFIFDLFARQHLCPAATDTGASLFASPQNRTHTLPHRDGDASAVLGGPHPMLSADDALSALVGGSRPWASLVCLALAQTVYTVWSCLCDVGVDCGRGSVRRQWLRQSAPRLTLAGWMWAVSFVALWWSPSLPLLHPAFTLTAALALYAEARWCCALAFSQCLSGCGDARGVLLASERDRSYSKSAAFRAAGAATLIGAAASFEGDGSPTRTHFCWWMFVTAVATGVGVTALARRVERHRPLVPSAVTHSNGYSSPQPSNGRGRAGVALTPSSSLYGLSPSAKRGGEDGGTASSSTVLDAVSALPPRDRLWTFVEQTFCRSSMKAVAALAALQAFSNGVTSHFFGLFLAVVCGHSLAPAVRACVLCVSAVTPHALVMALTPLYTTMGKKAVVSALLAVRTCCGVGVVLLLVNVAREDRGGVVDGKESTEPAVHSDSTTSVLFALFLFLLRVIGETLDGVQETVMGDVADEDTIIFGRPRAMAATIHHLLDVLARPARATAVMLTAVVIVAGRLLPPCGSRAVGASPGAAMLVVAFVGGVTVLCSGVALGLWHRLYTLEGKHLQFVLMAMRKRCEDEGVEQV